MISARELPHAPKPSVHEIVGHGLQRHSDGGRHGLLGHDDPRGNHAFSVAAGVGVIGSEDEVNHGAVNLDPDEPGNERVLNWHRFHKRNLAAVLIAHCRIPPVTGRISANRHAAYKTASLQYSTLNYSSSGTFVSRRKSAASPLQPKTRNSVWFGCGANNFLRPSRRKRVAMTRQLAVGRFGFPLFIHVKKNPPRALRDWFPAFRRVARLPFHVDQSITGQFSDGQILFAKRASNV